MAFAYPAAQHWCTRNISDASCRRRHILAVHSFFMRDWPTSLQPSELSPDVFALG